MTWLALNDPGTAYLMAADSNTALALTRAGVRGVIALGGGFQGADPTPTAADLEALVSDGELAYVMTGSQMDGPGGVPAGTSPGAGGPSDSGPARQVAQERAAWIDAHCSAVPGAPGGILACTA